MTRTAREIAKKSRSGKKSPKRNLSEAIAHVSSSFNNTVITITDTAGHTICWSSAGAAGFKGSRKSTSFAAQMAARRVGQEAQQHGVETLTINIKGPGPGRESAVRALHAVGFKVVSINDVTPLPHNGCRPPKRRRI